MQPEDQRIKGIYQRAGIKLPELDWDKEGEELNKPLVEPEIDNKQCANCKESKPLTAFTIASDGLRHRVCNACEININEKPKIQPKILGKGKPVFTFPTEKRKKPVHDKYYDNLKDKLEEKPPETIKGELIIKAKDKEVITIYNNYIVPFIEKYGNKVTVMDIAEDSNFKRDYKRRSRQYVDAKFRKLETIGKLTKTLGKREDSQTSVWVYSSTDPKIVEKQKEIDKYLDDVASIYIDEIASVLKEEDNNGAIVVKNWEDVKSLGEDDKPLNKTVALVIDDPIKTKEEKKNNWGKVKKERNKLKEQGAFKENKPVDNAVKTTLEIAKESMKQTDKKIKEILKEPIQKIQEIERDNMKNEEENLVEKIADIAEQMNINFIDQTTTITVKPDENLLRVYDMLNEKEKSKAVIDGKTLKFTW